MINRWASIFDEVESFYPQVFFWPLLYFLNKMPGQMQKVTYAISTSFPLGNGFQIF